MRTNRLPQGVLVFASDLDLLAKQYKGFISAWLVKKYKLGLKWGASRY